MGRILIILGALTTVVTKAPEDTALNAFSIASAAATAMLFSQTCLAGTATGKITLYHLNNIILNTGACIQMTPPISSSGFACVRHVDLDGLTENLLL